MSRPYIAPPQAGEEHRRVKFKVAWSHYRVDDEIVPNGALRSFLISNGYAVPAVRTGAQREEPPKVTRDLLAPASAPGAVPKGRGGRYAVR